MNLQDLDPRLFSLLSEQGVTDVLIDGARDCWVDRGRGLEIRSNPFSNEPEATAAALKLAEQDGVRLDLAKPFADLVASAAGAGVAVRIHLVLASEVCERTQICIRVFAERPVLLYQLIDVGMVTAEQAGRLREMVRLRRNFLITGATGSGKTTVLRAMAAEFGGERVITIEDIPELRLEANALPLLTRQSNQDGRGAITSDELLIQCLRMRPDRILLGELRGSELGALLRVLNTGHGGVGATLHANSPESVWSRLQGMAQLAGLRPSELGSMTSGVIDWVIHCESAVSGRRVASISKFSRGSSMGETYAVSDHAPTSGAGRRRRLEVI